MFLVFMPTRDCLLKDCILIFPLVLRRSKTFDDISASPPTIMVAASGRLHNHGAGRLRRPPHGCGLHSGAWGGPNVIECFGIDRCLVASNFAVDKLFGSYDKIYNAYKEILQNYSEEENKKLFSQTANRIYKIR